MLQVFIGYDAREYEAFDVARKSLAMHNYNYNYLYYSSVNKICIRDCRKEGLYYRPTSMRDGQLYDDISQAPMATEFALTRFLVPELAGDSDDRWALFMDCDVLVRCDILDIMKHADSKYAVMCVKHDIDHGTGTKMRGYKQTQYARKNWSSVMLWNLDHPANKRLTVEHVNTCKGLWLHQLSWLEDHEIGKLPYEWNHLVGLLPENENAKIVHYTLGTPNLAGYEDCEYSNEWKVEFKRF